jgi:hypothetical protein
MSHQTTGGLRFAAGIVLLWLAGFGGVLRTALVGFADLECDGDGSVVRLGDNPEDPESV